MIAMAGLIFDECARYRYGSDAAGVAAMARKEVWFNPFE